MATLGFSFYPQSIVTVQRELREVRKGIKKVDDPKQRQALIGESIHLTAKLSAMKRINRAIQDLRALEGHT
jgi:hypothetical protein